MKFSMVLDMTKALASMQRKRGYMAGDAGPKALATAAERFIVPEARANLCKNGSVFAGHLRTSLTTRVVSIGGAISVVEIVSLGVDYGKNIEDGTPPGLPYRVDAKLVRWARLKLHAANPVGAAYAVAYSLRVHGQKAKPFLRPAYIAKKGATMRDFAARWAGGLGRA